MSQSGSQRGLGGNTSWMMAGLGLRLGAQAVYFVLIARALGSSGFGAFIGVVALVAIVAPLATWGSGNVLIKHVARRPETFPVYWGRALVTAAVSGTLLTVAVLVTGRALLPGAIPTAVIALIAMSDLLFARVIDLSGQAFQAFERMDRTAMIQVVPSAAKLIAAAALLASGTTMTVTRWAAAYLVATAIASAFAAASVRISLGRAARPWSGGSWELREGFFFSISLSAQTIYNDIDKTMLTRIATLGAAGVYGAAYRVIDVAIMPLRSLLAATYARFFRHGAEGLGGSMRFGLRLLPVGVAYGLAAGIALWAGAPLLSGILGDGFAEAADAMRWLAFLPLMKVLSGIPADAMTGADRQGTRSAIQICVGVLNVILCLWLIPAHSWRGAAAASLVSDGALAAALWATAFWLRALHRPSVLPVPSRA